MTKPKVDPYPEGTITVTMKILPHDMEQIRAKRFPHPDLRRLMIPEWWTMSLFGKRAGRDPIPRILHIKMATKADLMALERGGRSSGADPE